MPFREAELLKQQVKKASGGPNCLKSQLSLSRVILYSCAP
jgi:hypothetical protein